MPDAQFTEAALRAVDRYIAPSGIPKAEREERQRAADAALQAALSRTRWHRRAATFASGVGALCVETGLWISPLPTFVHLWIQGGLAVVVAVFVVLWADVTR
jgi:hypothetical protein